MKSILAIFVVLLVFYSIVPIYFWITSFLLNEKQAGLMLSSAVVFLAISGGFSSIKKSIKLLKNPQYKDDPNQDLIINGIIRLPLTVKTIAWLKLCFWLIFYSIIMYFMIYLISCAK